MRKADSSQFRPAGVADGKLELVSFREDGEHVIEGILKVGGTDNWFPILQGVPSFLTGPLRPDLQDFCGRHGLALPADAPAASTKLEQAKTNETFSDKWRRFKTYGLQPEHEDFLFGWYCKKFALPDREALKAFYRDRERVLEVGPGSGFNTRFIAQNCKGHVTALDISDAAFTTFGNTSALLNCTTVQADLMDAPFADGTFDFIIADGVLHHTPDTKAAVNALYRKLRPGGQFFFYVYRKMGAARQFCDAMIREHFTKLTPEECYAACEGLTVLGRELSKLNATITLDTPIPVLGIPAGTHDVQRLIYYNFVKCFWNDSFDFETNNMVNFDWYHPHNAWQHTQEEVAGWLEELGVTTYQFNDSNPNGISVLLTKPKV
ncbi:methyltransferase domain-containing protein [Microvirga terricola]|uniref:Class I SAM-dependent methyltransferase n=1 Tax=Microvirga terricola TaxID=2719797 RepID=A0ABX0VAE6_9HYPH|nr:class I SAM-dependent methyltransferase [Microvirga terricola]